MTKRSRRQTISVKRIKEMANAKIAQDNTGQEGCIKIAVLLEDILFETGNYAGFNYIAWHNGGYKQWVKACQEAGDPDLPNSPYLGADWKRFYY